MQSAQRKTDYGRAPQRVVKMRGNVAYINNDFVNPAGRPRSEAPARTGLKPQPRAAAGRRTRPRAVADTGRKRSTGRGIASTLFVVFVAFCALALLVSRHATLTSISVRNNALQRDIAAVEARIEDLQMDLDLRSTVASVQNTAQQKLGMTYPVQNQTVTISLDSR